MIGGWRLHSNLSGDWWLSSCLCEAILHASSVHESDEGSLYWGPSMVSDDTCLKATLFHACLLTCYSFSLQQTPA